jgi:hypothetical protein
MATSEPLRFEPPRRPAKAQTLGTILQQIGALDPEWLRKLRVLAELHLRDLQKPE